MSARERNSAVGANSSVLSDLDLSDLHDGSLLRLLDEPFDTNVSKLRDDAKYNGFDSNAGNTWIYPINHPIRQYQFNISRASLFKNTLVVLPTGLGKTFIAAVVMYNMFRWYPNGKIIFMAPTKPLVAQQIDACYQIMGIPKEETAELTGKQNKKKRTIEWRTKRVFYATPQVVWSDLNDPEINFPLNDVKLLVIDEAHKAKGKYAYVEVVQSLAARNQAFRVLALSATPGRDIKDVIEVIRNLFISHIEIRWENSIDVMPYVFKKSIKTKVVPLGNFLGKVRADFIQLIDPYIRNLTQHQVIQGHSGNLSKNWLIMDHKKFRENSLVNRHPDYSSIMADFSMCISLYHALELLERHGVRVFLNYFDGEQKNFVLKDANVKRFVDDLREQMGAYPFPANDVSFYGNISIDDHVGSIDYGHPKFDILRDCVVEHFQSCPESKAIIFCEYRESVFLINRMLIEASPQVKPKVFVGQGSSHARTITQKEQIAIMKDFKSGVCNVLIATCVAEEGIDVGEVDLIVCFDVNNKNPVRYVQRIGRTGRRRQGKVIMLVTEGKEQSILRDVMATKDGTNQKISKSSDIKEALYRDSPRMVPPELHPQCIETIIKIGSEQVVAIGSEKPPKNAGPSTSKVKKPTAKSNKRVQSTRGVKQPDIRRALVKRVEIDDEILNDFDVSDVFCNTSAMSHANPDETMSEMLPAETSVLRSPGEISTKQKFARICERYRELKICPDAEPKPLKAAAVINNVVLPKPVKLLWLKQNLDFVREHYKRQKTSRLYPSIAKIIGGDQAVQHLLAKPIEQCSNEKSMRQMSVFQMLILADREEKENVPDIAPQNMSKRVPENDAEISSTASLALASQLNFGFVESKYVSQFESQLPVPAPLPPSSQSDAISSSTPKRVHKTAAESVQAPVGSPIQRKNTTTAFEGTIKNKNVIPEEVPQYLRYLGLSSIDDLFADSDDEEIAQPQLLTEKTDANSNNITIRSAESDLFADESIDSSAAPFNTSANTTHKKMLNVGSISDLFRDDDDLDEEDEKAVDVAQLDPISMTGSDDTEDYDFEEIISVMDAAEAAVNRSTSTSEKENRDDNQAEPVVRQKSDDLFATFNETNAMNANQSRANGTNVSKFFAPSATNDKSKHSGVSTDSNELHSPSNRLNNAIVQDISPSVLNRSSNSRSLSGASTKSLQEQYNAATYSVEVMRKGDASDLLRFGIASTSHQPKKLNFSRLKANADASVASVADISEEIPSTQFLTCKEITTSGQLAAAATAANSSDVDQMNINISTESETPDEDEIFATCRTAKLPEPQPRRAKRKALPLTIRRKKKVCAFIDDEAGVSGDDSSDEDMDDFLTQQMEHTVDIEEGDPSVDMQAKYLQSVRSPPQVRCRIPPAGYRSANAMPNIFSQYVAPDVSTFQSDSFVVSDEYAIDVDEESEMSELERAEMMLREKKRQKRKLKQDGQLDGGGTKKRRRIVVMDSDSD